MYHQPVLLQETIKLLQLQPGDTVLDGTIGGGGHARAILEHITPGGRLFGFDRDAEAISHVQKTLLPDYAQSDELTLIHDNFSHFTNYSSQYPQLQSLQAVILDLGVSWHQLDTTGRGFSFQRPNDPLDMRMDTRQPFTAAELLNTASEVELTELLRTYGEEPNARRIARHICTQRQQAPLRIIDDVLRCVALGYRGRSKPRTHMATRTLQAIRIAVNEELALLPAAIENFITRLSSSGRLAVITFQPLEERIVKQAFRLAAQGCICPSELPICVCQQTPQAKIITRRPIFPSEEEIQANPKARSAKLRVIEKL